MNRSDPEYRLLTRIADALEGINVQLKELNENIKPGNDVEIRLGSEDNIDEEMWEEVFGHNKKLDCMGLLIKNNIEVIFSVDGMEKSQIANRPNHSIKKNKESHNKIISNLENISQTNLNFSINMVVGPDNLEHLEENVEFLFNKGAKRIRVSYMMGVYWEMSQIKDLFRKVSYLFKKHNMKYTAITACKDEPVLISSGIAINYKGDIYVGTTYPLLHKFNSLKKINYYGNIYKNKLSDIKTNKKKQLIRALSSTSEDTDEFHLLANNIFLGINYQKMFQRLEKKRRD